MKRATVFTKAGFGLFYFCISVASLLGCSSAKVSPSKTALPVPILPVHQVLIANSGILPSWTTNISGTNIIICGINKAGKSVCITNPPTAVFATSMSLSIYVAPDGNNNSKQHFETLQYSHDLKTWTTLTNYLELSGYYATNTMNFTPESTFFRTVSQ